MKELKGTDMTYLISKNTKTDKYRANLVYETLVIGLREQKQSKELRTAENLLNTNKATIDFLAEAIGDSKKRSKKIIKAVEIIETVENIINEELKKEHEVVVYPIGIFKTRNKYIEFTPLSTEDILQLISK